MKTFLWLLSGLLSPRCCRVSRGLGAIAVLAPYVVHLVRQLSVYGTVVLRLCVP